MLALRLRVFTVLVVLFLTGVITFKLWGRTWSVSAYKPVLLEAVESARASQQYGKAEAVLLQAVRASPEYAYDLFDTIVFDLVVMPELSSELSRVFKRDATGEESPLLASANLARTRFARGDYTHLPSLGDAGSTHALAEHIRYLRAMGPQSLDRLSDGETSSARIHAGEPFPKTIPEVRDALASYEAILTANTLQGNSPRGQYLTAVANIEFRAVDAAKGQFAALAREEEFLPDSAYRFGTLLELDGKKEEALRWYAVALTSSNSHADAAAAYLRLAGDAQ